MIARILIFVISFLSPVSAQVKITVGEQPALFEQAKISIQLQGRLLIKEMEFIFKNEEKNISEGTFTCPLEKDETIVAYAMDVMGKKREGVIVPVKRGRVAYEEIVSRKVDPGILELDEEANTFSTRVYPLTPGGTKTIWLTTMRILNPGKAIIWHENRGTAREWNLEISGLSSGPILKKGYNSSIPSITSHIPELDLTYSFQAKDGTNYQCQLPVTPPQAQITPTEDVEIWLDGSSPISQQTLHTTDLLLSQLKPKNIILRTFRDIVDEPLLFTNRDDLLAQLSEHIPRGMARPSLLPWASPESNSIIFISDGQFPEGKQGIISPPCPLHIIDSGNETTHWLRRIALATGGGWHTTELDRWSGHSKATDSESSLSILDRQIINISRPHTLPPNTIITPAAKWIWAHQKSQRMRENGNPASQIEAFNHKHGVLDSQSSWLVLETARDYYRYDFTPPKSEPKLFAQWETLKNRNIDTQEHHLTKLSKRWHAHCDQLSRPPQSTEIQLKNLAKEIDTYWADETRWKDLDLDQSVQELRQKTANLIQRASKPENSMELLSQIYELEKNLHQKKPFIRVIIGGQIRQQGPVDLKRPFTLRQAITLAGGVTPFGAANRVKIYRNGKMQSHDIRQKTGLTIPLQENDLICVPEKRWYGNGGRKAGQTPPFSSERSPTITIKRGDWSPETPYVKELQKALDAGNDWTPLYLAQRSTYGWRADFYLDVIELLERRSLIKEARLIAGELAEHLPNQAEALRKAACTFRRLNAHSIAHALFLRIHQLEDKSNTSHYDLARSYEGKGKLEKALHHYWQAILLSTDRNSRSIVYLEDMNAMIARHQLHPKFIDTRLIRHEETPLRIKLEWDAKQANLDLILRNPRGKIYGQNLNDSHFTWSPNITKSYGPESVSSRNLLPGTWKIEANFWGDWRDKQSSTVTAEIEIIQHPGTHREKRTLHATRIREKQLKAMTTLKFLPEDW